MTSPSKKEKDIIDQATTRYAFATLKADFVYFSLFGRGMGFMADCIKK